MSDTPTPVVDPAPAPAAVPDPVDAAGWEAKYRDEVKGRINERNLYKPAQRLLADLDEDSRTELIRLADMARSGDREGITQWSLDTISAVNGKDAAALIAERQAAQQSLGTDPNKAPDAPKPEPGMTPAEVAQMVRDQMAADRRIEQGRQDAMNQLKDMGYADPFSAAAKTVVQYAVDNKCDLPTAHAWFTNDIAASVSARARAAGAAAATVPGTAPAGAPAGALPDTATGREKAMARLQADTSGTS